jgi:GAF domain-containing protein/ActR/RegA family two-component response regulator
VGHRHDEPHEGASRRGASLSRRSIAGFCAVLAAVWLGGAALLLHETSSRRLAQLDVELQRFEAEVQSAESVLRREAALLAQDPVVVDGARLGDAATVARSAPRLHALTTERVADLVMVLGPAAVVLAQIPPAPPVTLPLLAGVATPTVRLARLEREPFLLGVAPIAGDQTVGLVVLGRQAARLAPAGGGAFAVFVVADDTLRHSTHAAAPVTGWREATAAGVRTIDGVPWRLRPAGRLGSDLAWVGASTATVRAQAQRLAWLLVGGLVVVVGLLAGAASLARPRRRAPSADRANLQLETLYSAAVAMASGSELEPTATRTLGIVCSVARIDVGLLYRVDAGARRLVLVAGHGVPADKRGLVEAPPLHGTRVGEVVRTGRHQLMDLTGEKIKDAALRTAATRGGYTTQLALPVVVDGVTWGVLVLVTRARRRFDRDELLLLQGVAHQVGLAVARAALFTETQTKTRRLEMLTQVAQRLTASVAPDELLQRVVDAARQMFEAKTARLWLLEEDGETLALRAASGIAAGIDRIRLGDGLVGRAAAERTPVVVRDLQTEPRAVNAAVVRSEGLRAFAAVPLVVGGRLLGTLAIATGHERDFGQQDLDLLGSLANQAAVALDSARLLTAEQARRQHMGALLDINTKIGALVSTETLLTSIAEEAARLLGLDNAGFRILEGDDLVLAGLAGTARETMLRPRLKIGESLSGKVVAAGRTLVVPLPEADLVPDHAAADHALGYTTYLGVPLRLGDRTIGVLTFRGRRAFTARDQELAEAFAGQAAVAIEHARLYREATRRAERMAALADVSRLVTGTLEPGPLAERIVQSVIRLLGARSASLFRLEAGSGDLVSVASARDGGSPVPIVFPCGVGAAGRAALTRQAVTSSDVLADPQITLTPEVRDWVHREGRRAALGVPLVVNDRVVGALSVGDAVGRVFDAEEVQLAQAFADQASLALDNARLYQEARAYAERLRALEEVNRLISSSLNAGEVLANLARAIAQFFDAPYVSVWRFDAAEGRLRRALAHGDPALAAELHDDLAVGEGAVGWVVEHREPIVWTDTRTDPRYVDGSPLARRGLYWLTAYPITLGERVLGAFAVHRATAWTATPETELLMGSLAAEAAVALENARMYSETSARLAETRALLEVAEILGSTLDSTQLLERVAVKIAQVCAVDRCSIELWQGERTVPLISQFADGRPMPERRTDLTTLGDDPLREIPVNAQAIETRRPVVVQDAATTTLVPAEWVERWRLKAFMTVPMVWQDQVMGVMTLDYCERALAFEPWQADLATAIAHQLALALENSRLYAEAQERLRETLTLLAVGRVLSQPDSGHDVMRRVASEVARAFGADMAGAYLLDERRERLFPVGGYHVPKELVESFQTRPIVLAQFPWLLDAWSNGHAAWSADVLHDPRFDSEWTRVLPQHSVLFVPTMAHGSPVGGLFLVWWQTGRAFTTAEIRLIEGVAAQVGLAMENAELTRQTRVKLAETETLLSASRAVSSTLDLQSVLRHFLRSVAKTIGADCVGSWMVQEDGEWLEPLAGYRIPREVLPVFRELRISLLKHAFYTEAARTRRPAYTTDARHDSRLPAAMRELTPHRTQLFVPVVVKDRMIAGFAAVWWEQAREFSEGELALMEALANQAGVALENARLFAENRRRVEELSVLHDLSRAVTGQLDRAALIAALRSQLARVLDAENMVIVLKDEERGDLEVALRVAGGVEDLEPPRRFPADACGLVTVVLQQNAPLRTDDYAASCAQHGMEPVTTSAGLRHWLGAPMNAGEHALGVIVVRGRDRAFTDADERLLTNIAHLAALAMSSSRLYEERTRALGELSAAQSQLVRTEKLRALGEMASGVAHDFNNLLAAILGRAQLLLRRVEEPKQRQWLQVIERSALDGAQTVRRLQDFTRIRRDEPMVPTVLSDVVRDALEITQSRWEEEPASRGLTIQVQATLPAVPPILGDGAELREVFTNLILNAVDAMPEGGTLAVGTAVADGHVVATVADTGIGIPEAVRDKVFDPFFTTKGPRGTGLGLSMSYGIVSRHGGTISVDSTEGQGTTFRLTFPLAVDSTVASVRTVRRDAGPLPSLRCLVVDDEPSVRTVLVDVLTAAGHQVAEAGDGVEAIDRIRAERFDLVLTDLAMPRVSGWQVARAAKHATPGLPVFLVTGFGVELSMEERRANGVDAVLVKPLQIQEMLDAVAEVARTRPPAGPPEER